ncbi:hypothetical protein LEMLEM_LOCUS3721 [Lemmus lemmus]
MVFPVPGREGLASCGFCPLPLKLVRPLFPVEIYTAADLGCSMALPAGLWKEVNRKMEAHQTPSSALSCLWKTVSLVIIVVSGFSETEAMELKKGNQVKQVKVQFHHS